MKFKRIFISVTLALSMVLGLALPVLADSYLSYYPITIEDTSGGGRTNLPIITGVEGQDLIDAGLISASGTNTRMRIGSNDIYYMPSETQIPVFLDNLPASGQSVVDLYTGYDPTSTDDWRVITGEDGYVTVADDDTLELGSDFEIEQKGWIDTTGGADTNLIYKQHTFRTYIDGSEAITSEITPWTSGTYRPDPHDEVTSVDGWAGDDGNDAVWATVRAEPGNTSGDNDASSSQIIWIKSSGTDNQWDTIGRGIYLFDTSAIPDTATVTEAVFSIYGASKVDNLTITPDINVYSSDPASDVAIVNGDFDSLGATAFCDTPITYAGWDIAGYNDFTLNAAGLAAIDITDITKLGVRNASYDVANNPPAWANAVESKLGGYFADEAGIDKDPKLVVSYTEAVIDVTATSITDEEYTVRTYGVANEPEWATGDVLHFTGADDSNVNAGAIHNASAKLWVSLWFKLDSDFSIASATDQWLWGKVATPGVEFLNFRLAQASGTLQFYKFTGGGEDFSIASTETSWNADQWYHIIASISSVEGARLIIDGGTPVTDADVSATPNGGDCVIGDRDDPGAVTGFIGEIQNVIVGTGDLSTDEEDALYAGTAPTGGNAPTNYWYIDEGTGTGVDIVRDYGSAPSHGDVDTACSWETATFTTGETGRLCDFYIEVDDGVTDADRWGENLKGDSVPDSDADYIIGQNNTIPYAEYHKITVAEVLHAWYEPNYLVDAEAYDGTADNGTLTTIVDAELVQADDYWNDALLTITDTTDDLAPEGETSVITDFDDGTNTLTFSALTVAPDAGDTYTVDFGTLIDRSYYGLDFDGNDDVVDCGNITELNSTATFTLEGWFNQTTLDVTDWLFSKWIDNNHSIIIQTHIDGELYISMGTGAALINGKFDYSAVVTQGEWFHIVVVYDGGQATNALKYKCYINAALQTLDFSGGIPATTQDLATADFCIGNRTAVDTEGFQGVVDETRVYSRALEQDEIDYNYNSGDGRYTPYSTSGLVLQLHMEEGSGGTTADTSGEGNTGTITGATWVDGFVPRPAGSSGTNDSRLTWGVNSSVTITYGEIESDEPTASVVSEEPGYDVPEADMPTEWYGTGANVANLPLYDMYSGIETQTGIPVQTLYIFSIVGMCFAFAIAGFVMFNSVMIAVIGIVVALGIGTSMTIVPMWITFTFLVLAIGIMYLKGRSGI